jgi:glycine/D-amino acid oxidase-like deaminating enzyme
VNSLVIGGTGQQGDWNTEVSEQDSQKILDGVCGMFPSLRLAKVLGTYVGLRPGRPSVRLDSELVPAVPSSLTSLSSLSSSAATAATTPTGASGQQLLVRCYGLGGSGYTIGPGLAQDVVENHIRPFVSRMGPPLARRVARF